MEISEYVIPKLIKSNIINNLSVNTLKEMLKVLFSTENTNLNEITNDNCNIAIVKEAYVNILSFMVEAAKHDYSVEQLNKELNLTCTEALHIQLICDSYKIHKDFIQRHLQVIGYSYPHIIDVKWILEYTNVNNLLQPGCPRYSIFLTTVKNCKLSIIKFTCNVQQLQEIVFKLKDVFHHLHKFSEHQ